MGKYYLRYLMFLLPALVVSLFFKNNTSISVTLQWFFAFFMMIGFGANTVSAAYHFPRATMSFILGYTGVNLLVITMLYASQYDSTAYRILSDYAGALSYVPLGIMVEAMLDFNIQQEVYVTLFVTGCCMLGYIAGLVRRHVRPDPYSPRIG